MQYPSIKVRLPTSFASASLDRPKMDRELYPSLIGPDYTFTKAKPSPFH